MNAIEFVQKHGVDVARDLAMRDKTSIGYLSVEHHGLNQAELQEIVNAHEFVRAHGSVSIAKKYILKMTNGDFSGHYNKLRQYCELVEQCNAKP